MHTNYIRQVSFESKRGISANYLLGLFFVVCSLLPWLSFRLLNLDSQPWPFLAAFLFLISIHKRLLVPTGIRLAFGLTLAGLFMSYIASNNLIFFLTARAFYNYISFFFVYVAFYNFLIRYGAPFRVIKVVNYVWLLVAVVEVFFPAATATLTVARTTLDRGVTSFAPEPTFFGIYLLFSSLLLFQLSNWNWRSDFRLHFLNFIALLLLARSTMGLLMVLICLFFYFLWALVRLKPKKQGVYFLLTLLVSMAFFGIIVSYYLGDSRIFSLVSKVIGEVGILAIFYLDASMNARLEDIVFSLHGAVGNFLLPGGLDTFSATRVYLSDFYDGYFWYSVGGDKIMSWLGDWAYSLGIFGIFAVFLVNVQSYDQSSKSLIFLLLILVLLLSAVPVAFPLVPMLFATLAVAREKRLAVMSKERRDTYRR